MKNFIRIALLVAAASIAVSCNGGKKKAADGNGAETKDSTETMANTLAFDPALLPEEPVFDINTNMGTITVKLYSDTPKHRDNFVKLASERFYDGILFHRIIKGFMIQTGDPLTKDPANKAKFGTGGPGYEVPAEIVPTHSHIKGALAAARKGDQANPMKNSSGSQFYIVENPGSCKHLDGEYTVFGETVNGFDVIDKIASVQVDGRDCPLQEVKIISIVPVGIEQPATDVTSSDVTPSDVTPSDSTAQNHNRLSE